MPDVDIRQKFDQYYSKEQVEVLNRAFDFASKMHEGQKRESGEPYIIHPIAVANILIDLGLDYCAVSAALLHDCVEDTPATPEDIKNLFGAEIAELVAGVTKLKKLSFKSKEEEQAENFRRMFFAIAKDIRVLIIKIADRLHNMRTIASISRERQLAMSTDTL